MVHGRVRWFWRELLNMVKQSSLIFFAASALAASCGDSRSEGIEIGLGASPLLCVDNAGNPVAGAECGEDRRCRDANGLLIEGTVCIEDSCTVTNEPQSKAFWKNHPDAWPVNELMLDDQTYPKA